MKRIRLVVLVAAMMALMAASAVPAMAGVKKNHHGKFNEDRLDERADRIEERLEDRGFDVDIDEEDLIWWYWNDGWRW